MVCLKVMHMWDKQSQGIVSIIDRLLTVAVAIAQIVFLLKNISYLRLKCTGRYLFYLPK